MTTSRPEPRFASLFIFVALLGLATSARAEPAAVPLPKTGSCPSGYSTSGDYCLAGSNARHAIPKAGSCPSGYSTSGDYCLSSR